MYDFDEIRDYMPREYFSSNESMTLDKALQAAGYAETTTSEYVDTVCSMFSADGFKRYSE